MSLESKPFVARSYAGLFGLGGLAVLLTLTLAHPADRRVVWMVVPGSLAVLIALALLLSAHRGSARGMWLLPLLGSVLITAASYGAGRELSVAYATLYFWAVTSAFYFFPRRVAVPNVPLVAVLYAAEMIALHQRFVAYLMPMAALVVSAVLIDQLNVERGRLQSELEETIKALDEQARTDPVTGLPNRREFDRYLGREVARALRGDWPLSLLMIDLDHFKAFNDTHGHLAGDRLLHSVGRLWEDRLRVGDMVVRFGGDEFAAVLPECQLRNAQALAERLRAGLPQGQTCSIGVAEWRPGESSVELIRRADDALLMAKRGGRDDTRLASEPSLLSPD